MSEGLLWAAKLESRGLAREWMAAVQRGADLAELNSNAAELDQVVCAPDELTRTIMEESVKCA